MDNPKDHEGLSFGCNGALGDGETKNGTMDNKEPDNYNKAYILIFKFHKFHTYCSHFKVSKLTLIHVYATLIFNLSSSFSSLFFSRLFVPTFLVLFLFCLPILFLFMLFIFLFFSHSFQAFVFFQFYFSNISCFARLLHIFACIGAHLTFISSQFYIDFLSLSNSFGQGRSIIIRL